MGAKKGELTYHERTTAEKRDDAEKKESPKVCDLGFSSPAV